jgi:hypothetical protein
MKMGATTRTAHPIVTISLMGMGLSGSLLMASCSKNTKGSEEPKFEGCPSQPEEVLRLQWTMDETLRTPVKNGLLSVAELTGTMVHLEDELTEACSSLAKMLYAKEKDLEPETYTLGAQSDKACSVAGENLGKLKDLSGGRVKITAGAVLCSTPTDGAATCLAACGSSSAPQCMGQLQGSCPGVCTGQCTDENNGECAGKCGGMCDGSCDSEFEGVCRGKCEGTCNAKPSKDECDGTCVGRCLESARGVCGGVCTGSCNGPCTLEAAGECTGVCAGECDKPLKDPRCLGPLNLAGDADACEKTCDGSLITGMRCERPRVAVRIEGATNEDAADLLKRALEQHLPDILAAKALNVESDRLQQLIEASKAPVEKMKEATQAAADTQLDTRNENCIVEKVNEHATALSGAPSVLLAAERARDLGASEL